jgi:hypothetical protein
MSTDIICTYPESYLHVTQALLDDQKRFYRNSTYNEIIKSLESELYANKGEDMFYEYAIKAVINFIKEKAAQAPSK